MGHARSASQSAASNIRPATAMENHSAVNGSRAGIVPISISTYQFADALQLRKQRGRYDNQSNYISDGWLSSRAAQSTQPQAQFQFHSKTLRDSSLPTAFQNLSISSALAEPRDGAVNLNGEPDCPKTPSSYIPRKPPSTPQIPLPPHPSTIISPYKTPNRSKSPTKEMFLSRSSNVTAPVPAFDVDDRFEKVESQYAQLRGMIERSNTERNDMEERLSLQKVRCTF